MQPWQARALRDAAKSLLPFQNRLRRIRRRLRPYQDNPANSRLALRQGLEQIRLLRDAGVAIGGTVLEFGSGWLPIIPALFHLAGAERLILTDIERLMDAHTLALSQRLLLQAPEVASALVLPQDGIGERLARFAPDYRVPWNAGDTPAASIDIIVSRAVLEHVPPAAVAAHLAAFRRIIRPGGAMCHIIDNSDHFEHGDKRLSRVNFLRFEPTDLWWRIACRNVQNYQNRLRHSDYIALFRQNGWEVVAAAGEPDAQALRDLSHLKLARGFHDRDPRDLAILTSYFVVRPVG